MNNYLLKAPSVSAYEYNVVTKRGLPWQPGFFRRAPWLGIIAFLGALGGILAAGVVLFTSNNKPIHEWSVQPTVYLAIASAATNILLHFALSQAVTVAWWRRALRKDTTVADLHRSWDYGQSLWAALTSGRHFSAIALASILVALIPVNGPLLQRATRVQSGRFEHNTDVRVNIAPEIPEGCVCSRHINQTEFCGCLTTNFVADILGISVIVRISPLSSRLVLSKLSKSSIKNRQSPLSTVDAKVHVIRKSRVLDLLPTVQSPTRFLFWVTVGRTKPTKNNRRMLRR